MVNHLFLHSGSSYYFLCLFLSQCGVSWCSLGFVSGLLGMWRVLPLFRCSVVLWRFILSTFYGHFVERGMAEF